MSPHTPKKSERRTPSGAKIRYSHPMDNTSPRPHPQSFRHTGPLFTCCHIFTVLFLIGSALLPQCGNAIHAENTPHFGHLPYAEANAADLVKFQGIQIHKDILPDLTAMINHAKKDGVTLIVRSGFRSIKRQRFLFYDIAKQRGQTLVERAKVSAPPGHSEHHTGKAVDFDDGDNPQFLKTSFSSTKSGIWLHLTAEKYNFHLSFPAGNAQGVSYDPWHWFWRRK